MNKSDYKILIVLAHPLGMISGELRELKLAELLNQNYNVRLARIGDSNSLKYYKDGILEIFPPDIECKELDCKDVISKELSRALIEFSPDLIVIKGMQYKACDELFNYSLQNNCKLAFILGGQVDEKILELIPTLIFTEYPRQLEDIKVHPSAKVITADKLIAHVEDFSCSNIIDCDIVNVGNFDESRKNQEMLAPFFSKYHVKYIGAGRRLESFKSIAAPYQNVRFLNFIGSKDVLEEVSKSKIMVHCSTLEGYPRCIKEALALGVPVVWYRTQVGPMPTDNGLFCTSSIRDFFSQVEELLQSDLSFESRRVDRNINSNVIFSMEQAIRNWINF